LILLACKAGFQRIEDGETCIDVDECENEENCERHEICINTLGSWMCCLPGFELGVDNGTCVDINECEIEPNCSVEKPRCFNTVGSFKCCENGLELGIDNSTCIDIDECENPRNCQERNQQCKNKPGHFECICIPFSYKKTDSGCVCNQGNQAEVCESCNNGASLVEEKYRTYCKDQITECPIYETDYRTNGEAKRLERDFPNIDHALRGYNILRGDLLRLSKQNFQKTDPGFTSSPIFGYTRKDHRLSLCEFKGYNPNTLKTCHGSSISRVYTNSVDISETLNLELNQEDERKEVEYTYDESYNALFTNSKSFGADVILSTGVSERDGNSHCIDKSEAKSVEIGNTMENNGQIQETNEVESTNRHKVSGGLSFGENELFY